MTYEDHCEETLQKLGDRHERVHRWLDEFAKDTYPLVSHRVHRHHEAGVEEVRHKWGDSAAKAAELHILSDVACYGMKSVPTVDEAEAMWGQEVVHHPDGRIEIKRRIPRG